MNAVICIRGRKLLSLPGTVTARALGCEGLAYMCIYYCFFKKLYQAGSDIVSEAFAQEICKDLKFPRLSWICRIYTLFFLWTAGSRPLNPTSEHHLPAPRLAPCVLLP